jgi:hypothetical protein
MNLIEKSFLFCHSRPSLAAGYGRLRRRIEAVADSVGWPSAERDILHRKESRYLSFLHNLLPNGRKRSYPPPLSSALPAVSADCGFPSFRSREAA